MTDAVQLGDAEERLRELYPGLCGTTLIKLRQRDKRPIDPGWNASATENYINQIDPSPIYADIAAHLVGGGNVGWCIPPGVLVLDADDEHSAAWLAEMLPDAPRQLTSKGSHTVVRHPDGVRLAQRARVELFEGVACDLRVNGSGQIACEPSIHPSGFEYSWALELPLDLSTLPEVPAGILEKLTAGRDDGAVPITEARWQKGRQHDRLVSMAGRLRGYGLSVAEIDATLQVANLHRCEEPGTRGAITAIAHSAGKWDQGAGLSGDAVEAPDPALMQVDEISFSGEGLAVLLDEPTPDEIYPGIPPDGHMTLLVAPSFSGKTSLALWVGMARVTGEAAWLGSPARERGRVLFYSIDEPPSQVAHRMAAMARHHPGGNLFSGYSEGFTVVGPHATIDPEKLSMVRFDDAGLGLLERFLRHARDVEGRHYTDVIIDAYSDMLPIGDTDNDNEVATRIGGELERMAVTHRCAVELIHHSGKPKPGVENPDPRDLSRGASALAAKARTIFTVEEEVGLPRLRRIRCRTNLTPTPKPLLLEVANDSGESRRLDFFRPHDPGAAYPIDDYLPAGSDWVSTNGLAKLLMGDSAGAAGGAPSQSMRREAAQVRALWFDSGLVEQEKGPRNAIMIRRRDARPGGE